MFPLSILYKILGPDQPLAYKVVVGVSKDFSDQLYDAPLPPPCGVPVSIAYDAISVFTCRVEKERHLSEFCCNTGVKRFDGNISIHFAVGISGYRNLTRATSAYALFCAATYLQTNSEFHFVLFLCLYFMSHPFHVLLHNDKGDVNFSCPSFSDSYFYG